LRPRSRLGWFASLPASRRLSSYVDVIKSRIVRNSLEKSPLILVPVLSSPPPSLPFPSSTVLSPIHNGPTVSHNGGTYPHSCDSLGHRSHLFQSTVFDAQILKWTVSPFSPPHFLFALSNATRFQPYTLAYHCRVRRGPSTRSLLAPVFRAF
jgi:hypothetical protein